MSATARPPEGGAPGLPGQPSLALHRVRADHIEADRLPEGPVLAALTYAAAALERVTAHGAEVLSLASGTPPVDEPVWVDLWYGASPVVRGRDSLVVWAQDAHTLFGALDLEPAAGEDFGQLAERAYRELFACLAVRGMPQLLRLWNYLPGINDDEAGLERYRRFNAGRQQAFLAAGRAAFEGAPAACGLGTPGGPLRIRFLAGREAPLAVENPRQVSAYHYPKEHGVRAPTFSRAAIADVGGGQRLLLVSGTASIVGHESRHAGDLEAQLDETLANLQAVVDAAQVKTGLRYDLADARCVVYLRHRADAECARRRFAAALGAQSRAVREAAWVVADICRRELLIEVEAHLAAQCEGGA